MRLTTPEVSARHCQLFREGGAWLAMDLASKNGTRLNGNNLNDAPTPLAAGDVLSVGFHTFHISLEE